MENLRDNVENPEGGIYDDMYVLDLGEELEKLKEENRMLGEHINSLELDIEKLTTTITQLKVVQDNLSRNISSLFLTARTEMERKDRMIMELRAQVDDMCFRRYNAGIKRKENSAPVSDVEAKRCRVEERKREEFDDRYKINRERNKPESNFNNRDGRYRDNRVRSCDREDRRNDVRHRYMPDSVCEDHRNNPRLRHVPDRSSDREERGGSFRHRHGLNVDPDYEMEEGEIQSEDFRSGSRYRQTRDRNSGFGRDERDCRSENRKYDSRRRRSPDTNSGSRHNERENRNDDQSDARRRHTPETASGQEKFERGLRNEERMYEAKRRHTPDANEIERGRRSEERRNDASHKHMSNTNLDQMNEREALNEGKVNSKSDMNLFNEKQEDEEQLDDPRLKHMLDVNSIYSETKKEEKYSYMSPLESAYGPLPRPTYAKRIPILPTAAKTTYNRNENGALQNYSLPSGSKPTPVKKKLKIVDQIEKEIHMKRNSRLNKAESCENVIRLTNEEGHKNNTISEKSKRESRQNITKGNVSNKSETAKEIRKGQTNNIERDEGQVESTKSVEKTSSGKRKNKTNEVKYGKSTESTKREKKEFENDDRETNSHRGLSEALRKDSKRDINKSENIFANEAEQDCVRKEMDSTVMHTENELQTDEKNASKINLQVTNLQLEDKKTTSVNVIEENQEDDKNLSESYKRGTEKSTKKAENDGTDLTRMDMKVREDFTARILEDVKKKVKDILKDISGDSVAPTGACKQIQNVETVKNKGTTEIIEGHSLVKSDLQLEDGKDQKNTRDDDQTEDKEHAEEKIKTKNIEVESRQEKVCFTGNPIERSITKLTIMEEDKDTLNTPADATIVGQVEENSKQSLKKEKKDQ